MEVRDDIHIAVHFVEGIQGKLLVSGRRLLVRKQLKSLNGGSRLNPVGDMSSSGVTSSIGTKVEEIVGYSRWTNLMLNDFNIEFVNNNKQYIVWTDYCQDYISDLVVAIGLPKPSTTGGWLKYHIDMCLG